MGDKKIEVVLELKNGQYVSSIKQSSDSTEKFKKNVDKAAAGAAGGFQKIYTAAKAYLGYQLAKFLIDLAGRFDDVSTSFNKLTAGVAGGSQGLLKSIQTAAKGTVSQLDIMKSSNLAITLMGEEVAEYLPRMMEIARATAQSQGVTVAKMYEDIIVASGRQSVMILDNLGISSVVAGKYMEEYAQKLGKTRMTLDDTQKRAAFFYAVMKAGGDIVAKTGTESLTFGQRIQLIKASAEDAAVTLVKKMIPGMEALAVAFTETDSEGESLIGTIGKWLSNLLTMFAAVIQQAKNLPEAFEQVQRNIKDMATGNYGYVQVRNQFEDFWSKADPKTAIAHIKKYEKSLLQAGFSKEYLQGKVNVLVAQSKYSWNQGEMKEDPSGKGGNKPGNTAKAEAAAADSKRQDEARKFIDSYRKTGMSQLDIISENHNQEFAKLKELNDQKLISEEEYLSTREKINKKYQDQINDYAIEKTQQYLSFGSGALGQINELYNMSANNRIMKLDAQYAKEVDVINKSTDSEEIKAAKIAQLDANYEAKKKKIQLENAKKQKNFSLFQALLEVPAMAISAFKALVIPGAPWSVPVAWAGAAAAAGMGMAKVKLIKDQPLPALADGGLATRAALAIIGEGKYKEAVVPYSPKVFSGLAEGIARAKNGSVSSESPVINHYHQYTFQGSYYDKDGFAQAVSEANIEVQRRTGVNVYSRKSVY